MTKSRIFFFLLVSFLLGVGVRSFVPIPYAVLWILFLFCTVGIVVCIFRKWHVGAAIGFFIIAALCGVVRYDWHEQSLPDLAPIYGKTFSIEGYVVREPARGEKSQTFSFRVSRLDTTEVPPFDIRITTGRFPEYRIGDTLSFFGTIQKPEKLGDFDYPSYLKKDGIEAVVAFPKIEKTGKREGGAVRLVLADLKRSFEENIVRALPEPHAAFLNGLVLGERESLPPDLVESFRMTGVTHLVALSGYNITIVATFFMSLLLFFTVRFYTAFWIAACGIIAFVILTGASPSVVRAGIMGILILIAEREGRIYQIRNALLFAAVLMVFVNPFVLRFDAAFELSFLATIGLIVFSPRIEEYLVGLYERVKLLFTPKTLKKEEKRNILVHTLAETLGAQLAVLPLIIFLFGQVSLISPITNVLVVLAVPYTMTAGFLVGVVGFMSDAAARIPAFFAWTLLEYMIQTIEFFARIPFASVSIPALMGSVFLSFLVVPLYFLIRAHGIRRSTN